MGKSERPPANRQKQARGAAAAAEETPETRGRLLFADDDPLVLQAMAAALGAAGFDVTVAADADQALSTLSRQPPDVLLLDVDMPGNENLRVLSQVSEDMPALPVILLTGKPSVDSAMLAVRLGVVDYLAKPPELNELMERIDLAIHRGRVLRSIETAVALAEDLAARLCALSQVIRRGPSVRLDPETSSSVETIDPLRNLSQSENRKLSPREREVLKELAKGRSPQQMAVTLDLSTNTVRNHLKSIFLKLGVNSQVALLGKLATPR